VITIIITLAGVSVGVFVGANAESSRKRARAEIRAIEVALDAYKADFGGFPTNTVTGLGQPPESAPSATPASGNAYVNASTALFKILCSTNVGGSSRVYLELRNSQVGGFAATGGGTNYYIKDPWGNPYGFSGSPNIISNPNAGGKRPDGKDLPKAMGVSIWSTGGGTTAAATNKWITNYDPARP
jgi:type II secretory pathway pseudopilin PulG